MRGAAPSLPRKPPQEGGSLSPNTSPPTRGEAIAFICLFVPLLIKNGCSSSSSLSCSSNTALHTALHCIYQYCANSGCVQQCFLTAALHTAQLCTTKVCTELMCTHMSVLLFTASPGILSRSSLYLLQQLHRNCIMDTKLQDNSNRHCLDHTCRNRCDDLKWSHILHRQHTSASYITGSGPCIIPTDMSPYVAMGTRYGFVTIAVRRDNNSDRKYFASL